MPIVEVALFTAIIFFEELSRYLESPIWVPKPRARGIAKYQIFSNWENVTSHESERRRMVIK